MIILSLRKIKSVGGCEVLVKAKKNYSIVGDYGTCYSFIRGKSYPCSVLGGKYYLIDENTYGYKCDREEFLTYFEEVIE